MDVASSVAMCIEQQMNDRTGMLTDRHGRCMLVLNLATRGKQTSAHATSCVTPWLCLNRNRTKRGAA